MLEQLEKTFVFLQCGCQYTLQGEKYSSFMRFTIIPGADKLRRGCVEGCTQPDSNAASRSSRSSDDTVKVDNVLGSLLCP